MIDLFANIRIILIVRMVQNKFSKFLGCGKYRSIGLVLHQLQVFVQLFASFTIQVFSIEITLNQWNESNETIRLGRLVYLNFISLQFEKFYLSIKNVIERQKRILVVTNLV